MKSKILLSVIIALLIATSGWQQYQINKLSQDLSLINDGSTVIINYALPAIYQLQEDMDKIKALIEP